MSKMIVTSECEECAYGEIDYTNKSRITVKCKARNKQYMYGQRIPCEDMKKKDNSHAKSN